MKKEEKKKEDLKIKKKNEKESKNKKEEEKETVKESENKKEDEKQTATESENKKKKTKAKKKVKLKIKKKTLIVALAALLASALLGAFLSTAFTDGPTSKKEIITETNLKRIIEVSELSTYECVYNGIATVNNEKKPEKVDYHVSYEATVKAGIDFEKVKIKISPEKKIITVDIPKVTVHSVEVDFKSMDFIIINKKAETISISADAYKKCIDDVQSETKVNDEIFKLAEKNAKNIIEALLMPFVNQLDEGYAVKIK